MKALGYMMAMAALAFVLAACDRRLVYDRYVSTPLTGWEKNDTLTFDIPPIDSSGTYGAWVGLRTTDAYPFTSVTLIVERHVWPGDNVATDTVLCQLADSKGNAAGKGVSYHQYRFALPDAQLAHGDSIHVRIRHDMKREILPGISDVGISLRRR